MPPSIRNNVLRGVYILFQQADKENKHRGFADFFPLDTPEFAKRIKTITMEEFVKREGGPNGRVPVPEAMRANVENSAAYCDKRKKSML